MIRGFLADSKNAQFTDLVDQVVMIGTPNHGTAAANEFSDKFWFKLLGQATAALGNGEHSFPNCLPKPNFFAVLLPVTRVGVWQIKY